MWIVGHGEFEEISFEKNILKFKSRKTNVVYLCNGETIRREDGKDPMGELSQMDQISVVTQYFHNKELLKYENKSK